MKKNVILSFENRTFFCFRGRVKRVERVKSFLFPLLGSRLVAQVAAVDRYQFIRILNTICTG